MNAEDIARRLGGKKNGAGWSARCPAHDDRNASLTIRDGETAPLLTCHAGCERTNIIDALKRMGAWPTSNGTHVHHSPPRTTAPVPVIPVPPKTPPPNFRAVLGTTPTEFWDYRDAHGQLIGYVARVDNPEGKVILPVMFCGAAGWRSQGFPTPRPLYGLPQLAERSGAPVLLVEGEKTCCAAATIFDDHVVTTWQGGAKATGQADWSPLRGRAVTLWPDADQQGEAAMFALSAILDKIAASVRTVKLPDGLPKGWDLADEPPAGLDPRALLNAAQDARKAKLAGLPIRSAADLMAQAFKEPKWAVPNVLAEGLAIMAGRPKAGKSWAALDFAVAVAGGMPALGNIECQEGDVLLLALEDNDRRLQQRFKAILQGAPMPSRLTYATEWKRADAGGLDDLRTWLAAHPRARLVAIDTLQKIRGERSRTEGIYADDYKAIGDLKGLADEFNVPFLAVHHTRKEATSDPLDSVSGTSGITGAADTILVLKREPKDVYGVLYVRGRDVPEAEIAMQFDEATGKWTRLQAGDDFRRSKERNAVIRLLIDAAEPMTPGEIADAIDKRKGTVRVLLHKMKQAGDVVRRADGTYSIPRAA